MHLGSKEIINYDGHPNKGHVGHVHGPQPNKAYGHCKTCNDARPQPMGLEIGRPMVETQPTMRIRK